MNNNSNKTVIILRGVPSSGKSSFAGYIENWMINPVVVCCADDYFTDENGNYNFDHTKLGEAHDYCYSKYINAVNDYDIQTVIVANTNTREQDVNKYRNYAVENNVRVFVLTMENWHNGQDIHNVSNETKSKMKEQLRNSIRL